MLEAEKSVVAAVRNLKEAAGIAAEAKSFELREGRDAIRKKGKNGHVAGKGR